MCKGAHGHMSVTNRKLGPLCDLCWLLFTGACFLACVLWTWYFVELHVWESWGSTLGNSEHLWVFFVISVLKEFSLFHFSSFAQSCLTLSDPMDCSTPGLPLHPGVYSNSCPLSWWCHPTISSSVVPFSSHLQSFPASGLFSSESVLHIRWPKYWSFSFDISPSSEYSGLISFRMDWLDLFAVQGTLKSFVQHHSSKASILQHSAFFIGPTLTSTHDYWKNHSLD